MQGAYNFGKTGKPLEISGNLLVRENTGKTQRIWNILMEFLYFRYCFFSWRNL